MLPLRLFLVLALMFPAAPLSADENRDTVVASTDRFEFHSNPRVALHHFLIAWAAADHDEWPPYALPIAVDVVVYCNPVGAYSTGGRRWKRLPNVFCENSGAHPVRPILSLRHGCMMAAKRK